MAELAIVPVTTAPTKIALTSLAVLTILSIVMQSGLLDQENVYACEDLNIAMQCDKLSGVNDDGLQTRCYFTTEEGKSTYKNCNTGWLEYIPEVKVDTVDINISTKEQVYLLCDKKNELVSECQIVDTNETIIRVGA